MGGFRRLGVAPMHLRCGHLLADVDVTPVASDTGDGTASMWSDASSTALNVVGFLKQERVMFVPARSRALLSPSVPSRHSPELVYMLQCALAAVGVTACARVDRRCRRSLSMRVVNAAGRVCRCCRGKRLDGRPLAGRRRRRFQVSCAWRCCEFVPFRWRNACLVVCVSAQSCGHVSPGSVRRVRGQ